MSFRAPPRRSAPDRAAPAHSRLGPATTPTPRTAPPDVPSGGTVPVGGTRAAGRFRHDLGTDTWTWSPEMFAVLGLDPGTTDAGAEALVRGQHPDDRVRTRAALVAACAGRAFALEVRSQGGRALVLVGEPELDHLGRVIAVGGLCADITAGRLPGSDEARVDELRTEVEQLRAAMASRAVIEQAKGILMLLTSCRDQTAFDLLGHISSHTHRKVRDVARAITESATGGARLPQEVRAILRDACPPTRQPS
jgi:ANTAR domain